jgi:hypothetical protein
LGVVYIFLAAILFLSDLPLSLNLVAQGFEISTSRGGVKVMDLFKNFSGVVTELWEPLFRSPF